MPRNGSETLVFAELLEALRRQGFAIGADHYLRTYLLLDRIGDSLSPAHLRTLLCPILATSREQQEEFYAVFAQLYPAYAAIAADSEAIVDVSEPAGESEPPISTSRQPRHRRFRGRQSIALALLAVGVLLTVFSTLRLPRPIGTRLVRTPTPTPAAAPVRKAETGNAPPAQEQQPATVQNNTTGVPQRRAPSDPRVESRTSRRVPEPSDALRPVASTSSWTGRLVAPLIALLALFALAEVVQYRRRRLVLRRERREKPPFVWPLRVPIAQNPYMRSESERIAARSLRRREPGSTSELDVERTIAATLDALGYPALRYKSSSVPVEYLLLVERVTPRDHQAALFSSLHAALQQEGVPVTRYFFDGDPRVCHRGVDGTGVRIGELRRQHPDHRLLVFATGDGMIDPISGGLHSWVAPLLSWRDRVLLTPEPPVAWGARELALRAHFELLPASAAVLHRARDVLDTLAAASQSRGAPSENDSVTGHAEGADWATLERESARSDTLAEALRAVLGDEAYQWVCACALYPELQWDLTLYLGGLAGRERDLVTEDVLLRLIRVPWFRRGVMPDAVRARLIQDGQPELVAGARRAIIHLLEQNPPPDDAAAATRYQLDLAVQRVSLDRRDRRHRRELRRAVDRSPRGRVLEDQVLVGLLESIPPRGTSLVLPRRLRRVFFNHGIPTFGWSTAARLSLALIGTLVIAILPRRSETPEHASTDLTPGRSNVTATVAPTPAPLELLTHAMSDSARVRRVLDSVVARVSRRVPDVDVNQILGARAAAAVLVDDRAQHVPAAFTAAGWAMADSLLRDARVVAGAAGSPPASLPAGGLSRLMVSARSQYDAEYVRRWQAFLGAARVRLPTPDQPFAFTMAAAKLLSPVDTSRPNASYLLQEIDRATSVPSTDVRLAFAPVHAFVQPSRERDQYRRILRRSLADRSLLVLQFAADSESIASSRSTAASIDSAARAITAPPTGAAAGAREGADASLTRRLLYRFLRQPAEIILSRIDVATRPGSGPAVRGAVSEVRRMFARRDSTALSGVLSPGEAREVLLKWIRSRAVLDLRVEGSREWLDRTKVRFELRFLWQDMTLTPRSESVLFSADVLTSKDGTHLAQVDVTSADRLAALAQAYTAARPLPPTLSPLPSLTTRFPAATPETATVGAVRSVDAERMLSVVVNPEINRYLRALRRGDFAYVQRAAESDDQLVEHLVSVLRNVGKVTVATTSLPAPPDVLVSGSTATTEFGLQLSYVNPFGRRLQEDMRFRATFEQSGETWKLITVRPIATTR